MSGIVQSSKARVLIASLGALLATPSVGSAQSTDYPSQRISFIVGFAVGGFADTIGRWVAIRLGERTGQTVVVQNMEGGGGVRAARRVAMSPPDGYTILVTTTSLTINESLVPNRGYTATAFDAVSLPVSAPESLSASVKSPIKSLADLVNEAKAGTVFMGSAGIGSGSHIAGGSNIRGSWLSRAVCRVMDRLLRASRHTRSGALEAQQRDQRDPPGAGDCQAHRDRRSANDYSKSG